MSLTELLRDASEKEKHRVLQGERESESQERALQAEEMYGTEGSAGCRGSAHTNHLELTNSKRQEAEGWLSGSEEGDGELAFNGYSHSFAR